MHRLQNMDPCEIVNVSCESGTDFLEKAGELTHLIGVLTTKNDISSIFLVYENGRNKTGLRIQ